MCVWYVWVCMHTVCVYVCVDECMHVHVSVLVCAQYAYVMWVCMCVSVCMWVCVQSVYVCSCVFTVCICMCEYVCPQCVYVCMYEDVWVSVLHSCTACVYACEGVWACVTKTVKAQGAHTMGACRRAQYLPARVGSWFCSSGPDHLFLYTRPWVWVSTLKDKQTVWNRNNQIKTCPTLITTDWVQEKPLWER